VSAEVQTNGLSLQALCCNGGISLHKLVTQRLRECGWDPWKFRSLWIVADGLSAIFRDQVAFPVQEHEGWNTLNPILSGKSGLQFTCIEGQGQKTHFSVIFFKSLLVLVRRDKDNFQVLSSCLDVSVSLREHGGEHLAGWAPMSAEVQTHTALAIQTGGFNFRAVLPKQFGVVEKFAKSGHGVGKAGLIRVKVGKLRRFMLKKFS